MTRPDYCPVAQEPCQLICVTSDVRCKIRDSAQPTLVPLTQEQRKALILQECRYTSEAENADHEHLIQAVERWHGVTTPAEKG
jgi:hypothetical protein